MRSQLMIIRLQRTERVSGFARRLTLALLIPAAVLIVASPQLLAQKRKPRSAAPAPSAAASSAARSISVRTEPDASVWLDEVRRGRTDAAGLLVITKLTPGSHALRVRAVGFREATVTLLPSRRGDVEVKLLRTTDPAELAFQEAEAAREKAQTDEARQTASELYRRALELRPDLAAAHVGLARLLLDLNDYRGALAEIAAARQARPVYPEASAVEGRIERAAAFEDAAIESYRRAIREARGFQPEAHTGLAIVYEDKGRLDEAAAEFRTAIAQLSDTEPVIYQLLGAVYERQEKYREAVAAYEKYLQLAPEGSLAPAVRSVIDQLRREAAEQEGPSPGTP